MNKPTVVIGAVVAVTFTIASVSMLIQENQESSALTDVSTETNALIHSFQDGAQVQKQEAVIQIEHVLSKIDHSIKNAEDKINDDYQYVGKTVKADIRENIAKLEKQREQLLKLSKQIEAGTNQNWQQNPNLFETNQEAQPVLQKAFQAVENQPNTSS